MPEGLALLECILVKNTSQLVNKYIPFGPTDDEVVIDVSNPFIQQLPSFSTDKTATSWCFDGIFKPLTDWINCCCQTS